MNYLSLAEASHGVYRGDEFSFRNRPIAQQGVDPAQSLSKLGTDSAMKVVADEIVSPSMPPASVMTRLILIMVWRKLIRNPNTYSSLLGVVWSLVSFR